MKTLFVDTSYWVARSHRRDQWHQKAREISTQLRNVAFVTTELVIVEYLNYFSTFGPEMRQAIAATVRDMLADANMRIIWQNQALFESGLVLYEARLDKGYSLTDCVSMVVMQQENMREVLTHDRHFTQEGFTVLL